MPKFGTCRNACAKRSRQAKVVLKDNRSKNCFQGSALACGGCVARKNPGPSARAILTMAFRKRRRSVLSAAADPAEQIAISGKAYCMTSFSFSLGIGVATPRPAPQAAPGHVALQGQESGGGRTPSRGQSVIGIHVPLQGKVA